MKRDGNTMFWNKIPAQQDILDQLQKFAPVASGAITIGGLVVRKTHVLLSLEIDPVRHKAHAASIQRQVEELVRQVKHVRSVQVVLTAEKLADPPTAAPRAVAPHVRHIIAVASGKGGVGKSTVAANLAVALGQSGLRVGLLDADVYGPSIPMLLGVRKERPVNNDEYLHPVPAHGIHVMSMGFMVDEEAPMVWRGPMVQSALLQMLRDVRWGTAETPLDVLVIDMPPGTGDTQLTIAQKVSLSGAVIVSTPQDVALLDTVKGVNMFQKVSVPIIGVVENMSAFCCPDCGAVTPVFGAGGAQQRAAQLDVPFLGGIPLALDVRVASDQGRPIVLDQTQPSALAFKAIAKQVVDFLGNKGNKRPSPRIVIEASA